MTLSLTEARGSPISSTRIMRTILTWLAEASIAVTLVAGVAQVAHAEHGNYPQTGYSQATIPPAVSLEELEQARGQGGVVNVTQLTNSQLNAELGNNIAVGNVTGNNTIDDSFSRASGLFSIIQNTGNNVIIQDSIIVNVTIFP